MEESQKVLLSEYLECVNQDDYYTNIYDFLKKNKKVLWQAKKLIRNLKLSYRNRCLLDIYAREGSYERFIQIMDRVEENILDIICYTEVISKIAKKLIGTNDIEEKLSFERYIITLKDIERFIIEIVRNEQSIRDASRIGARLTIPNYNPYDIELLLSRLETSHNRIYYKYNKPKVLKIK